MAEEHVDELTRLRQENAELRQRIADMERLLRELTREVVEWRQGHRVRDRRRTRSSGPESCLIEGSGLEPDEADEPDDSPTGAPAGAPDGESPEGVGDTRRRAGRPAGHEGSGRPAPKEVGPPVDLHVDGPCPCGGSRTDAGVAFTHRVEELVVRVEATEYRCHQARCDRCGKTAVAALPAELGGAPKVGPEAQAVAMALRFEVGLPVNAVSRVFSRIFGLPFSPGGLSQMFQRNLQKAVPVVHEIWSALESAPLVYCDETGWREDGKRAWLWAATTPSISVFAISPSRDRDTFVSMVSPEFGGLVATDGFAVYDHLPEERHPRCWAHPLRLARGLAEIHGEPGDAAARDAIRAFLRKAKAHRAAEWPSEKTLASATNAFEAAVAVARAAPHRKLRRLGERLDAQRVSYLLCLSDRNAPLTTNQVERDLRGAIPVRKLSFGTRNVTGSVQWSDGATLAQTLKKQGRTLRAFMPGVLAAHARGGRLPSAFT